MKHDQAILTEREMWDQAIQKYQDYRFSLSPHFSRVYRNHPKMLAVVLSRYKFVARLAAKPGATVLELQCGDGIGAAILGEHAALFVGVDSDPSNIQIAAANFPTDKYRFIAEPFLGKKYGSFSLVTAFDVESPAYLDTVIDNLSDQGCCIIGLESGKDLKLYQSLLQQRFSQVFAFGMNDEIIHTNLSASNYFLLLACLKKGTL